MSEIAFEDGYFDVPRGITLADLTDIVDISHQALSERLRRGEKRILENTVILGDTGVTSESTMLMILNLNHYWITTLQREST